MRRGKKPSFTTRLDSVTESSPPISPLGDQQSNNSHSPVSPLSPPASGRGVGLQQKRLTNDKLDQFDYSRDMLLLPRPGTTSRTRTTAPNCWNETRAVAYGPQSTVPIVAMARHLDQVYQQQEQQQPEPYRHPPEEEKQRLIPTHGHVYTYPEKQGWEHEQQDQHQRKSCCAIM